MAAFDGPFYNWTDNSTLNWGSSATLATYNTPMTVYPAMVAMPTPEPEPVPEGPLDWLRGQVAEIVELASAA